LRRLPRSALIRILLRIRLLARDPRGSGCEPLANVRGWRARLRPYRIVYKVDEAGGRLEVVRVAAGRRRASEAP
jgi:mRNA-degrading endonuclease RelE of RelBE toxin-antitoxin system